MSINLKKILIGLFIILPVITFAQNVKYRSVNDLSTVNATSLYVYCHLKSFPNIFKVSDDCLATSTTTIVNNTNIVRNVTVVNPTPINNTNPIINIPIPTTTSIITPASTTYLPIPTISPIYSNPTTATIRGEQGPKGDRGERGEKGEPGAVTYVSSPNNSIAPYMPSPIIPTTNNLTYGISNANNNLVSNINGVISTTTINALHNINLTGLSTISDAIITNATATNLSVSNVLTVKGNVLTSNLGGSTGSTSLITSNSLSFSTSTNLLTSIVNGISSSTIISGLTNISLFGTTTAGDILSGNIIPNSPYTGNLSSYSLGASTTRWNSIWTNTLNLGSSTWSLSQEDTTGRLGIYTQANKGGTEALSILANGNVGVGTTNPTSKLEINSGISGVSGLRFTNLTSQPNKTLSVSSAGDVELTDSLLTVSNNVANVYNSDVYDNILSNNKIPKSTSVYTTGSNPIAITIDSAGNIYTANSDSNNVSKITPSGVSTILGTTGSYPYAITIDSSGNIYTANRVSNNVSKITPSGVSTILGTTGSGPSAITIDSAGNIYTANTNDSTVSKITPSGSSTILGTTGFSPYAITIDSADNIYTANYNSRDVSKITPAGSSTILGTTSSGPSGITIDSAGNVYTTNTGSSDVSKITPGGTSTILGTTGSYPYAITIDSAGNIYTVNSGSKDITKITTSGSSTNFATGANYLYGIVVDSAGNMYTSNYYENTVTKVAPDGQISKLSIVVSTPLTTSTTSLQSLQLNNALFIKPSLTHTQYSTSLMDALVVGGAIRAKGFVVDYAADLAESFPTDNNTPIAPGTLVSFSSNTVDWNIKTGTEINTYSNPTDTYKISTVKIANKGDNVIGVISSNPGLLLGGKGGVPVAFQGRVPVLVDNTNGTIKKGDNLTLSTTTPGYATKQTSYEADIVGIAMSDDNGSGKVLMLVQNGYKKLDLSSASTTAQLFGNTTDSINLNNLAITNIKSLSSASGNWSIDENGRIKAKYIAVEGVEMKDSDGNTYCYKSQNGNLVKVGMDSCGEYVNINQNNNSYTGETFDVLNTQKEKKPNDQVVASSIEKSSDVKSGTTTTINKSTSIESIASNPSEKVDNTKSATSTTTSKTNDIKNEMITPENNTALKTEVSNTQTDQVSNASSQ